MNNTNKNPSTFVNGFSFGAATQIRTGDLILTKDVLYQLSHSSIVRECFRRTLIIITNLFRFVNRFFKKCFCTF